MVWIFLVAWLAISAAAFWLFVWSWRRDLDVNLVDAVVFAAISLFGPFSLFVALGVTVLDWLETVDSRVVLGRRK